ncbi:uncharacterized protein DUF3883 [Glaciihabitans tibetensis]|uniref:Uncharacterized protein DUF3883 n=1 Tax=Glaciihabitans tibetensis TaxID=1266600 RepID=A0A2T0VE00_9MICO|nr:DUF3883 domain-containing protein [Glaciihabitans tibetensis]PRY68380.1 uncharacterized protein DUF3883 [Glaciihabitans tibetensis]
MVTEISAAWPGFSLIENSECAHIRALTLAEAARLNNLEAVGGLVAVFSPTLTGFDKQIHDATIPVRQMLLRAGIIDYDRESHATPVLVRVVLVVDGGVTVAADAKFYRTARGDRRMRFSSLRAIANADDAIAIVSWKSVLWLFNLSAGTNGERPAGLDVDGRWARTTAPMKADGIEGGVTPDVPMRMDGVDGESVVIAHGFNPSSAERKAIETQAMHLALNYLITLGFEVEDVGDTSSYDIHAVNGEKTLWVEVKGTTTAGSNVILTKNEVALHRDVYPHNMLIVVSKIQLVRRGYDSTASGGHLSVVSPWDIMKNSLTPISYLHEVPTGELV